MNTCRCGAQWSGHRAAHCSGCHRTFGSVALFDLHRSVDGAHGACLTPETIRRKTTGERLMFFRGGVWRGPELSEEAIARLTASRGATNTAGVE